MEVDFGIANALVALRPPGHKIPEVVKGCGEWFGDEMDPT